VLFSDIRFEVSDRVAVITLNRPKVLNAMCLNLRQECNDALLMAEEDREVEAVVFIGDGEKAFSAGADVEELQMRTSASELSRPAEKRRQLPYMIESLAKPTIAAINGYALGAGLELALACTVRIASENAVLGLPEINLGVIPGSGGTQRLPRMVGEGRAMWMITSGEPIDTETALLWGLVTEVIPREQLLERAKEIGRKLGSKSSTAFKQARDTVHTCFDVDLKTGIEIERRAFAICADTQEKQELIQQFLARREGKQRS
jgi:enoyl-CoA hydratase